MAWLDRRKVWLVPLVSVGCALYFIAWGGRSDRFVESFDAPGVVEEAGSMMESTSDDWWVNSGGRLEFRGGLGSTLRGEAPQGDRWRLAYAKGDALDTEGGAYPQNLFRLVTRHKWRNARQEVRFRLGKVLPSASPNRNESNGVLLLHRYLNGDNLYYAGLRVDGAAVIKKKVGGVYSTLAYARVYEGEYHRDTQPSLLPLGRWLGLQTIIQDLPTGEVSLAVFLRDPARDDRWTRVAAAVDDGRQGGARILNEGFTGIRTDFAEVEFDDYVVEPIAREQIARE